MPSHRRAGEARFSASTPIQPSAGLRGAATRLALKRVAGFLAACLALPAPAATLFHVSPAGKDAWSGTLAAPNFAGTDGPKASLAGARDAVRALKAQAPLSDTVLVRIATGEYPLAETVVFTPADAGTAACPVIYAAAPGARPVFLGGPEIKGFVAGPDGLWKASLPEAAGGGWTFEQLWVDGRRAVRAREPDLVPDTLSDVRLQGARMVERTARSHFVLDSVREIDLGGGRARQSVRVGAEAARLLGSLDAESLKGLVLTVYHNWDHTRRRAPTFEAATATLHTEGQPQKTWNPWKRGYLFHLENFRSALDAPGEWFLASDGTLLYKPRPGESPATSRVFAPRLDRLLSLQGEIAAGRFVEHIHFRGLAFRHSQWLTPAGGFEPAQAASTVEAAVIADGTRSVSVTDCEFAHTGTYALWLRRGCRDIRLERNLLHDFGAGGIRIGEGRIAPAGPERTSHVTVHNNILRHGGRLFPCAVGLWIAQSGDNVVSRNDIGDLHYSGISSGWTWGYGEGLAKRNRFEKNHIHHVGKGLMADMAAYYGLGPSEGTVIAGNVAHDVFSFSYGGWGLYNDEGSTGVLMEGNLVYNTRSGAFHQHYGRDNIVRGNIFAHALEWQIQLTRVEPHRSFDFTRNIVYWEKASGLYGGPFDKADVSLTRNLFWAGGQGINFRPQGGSPALSLPAWQATGRDSGSLVADPLFEDPARYDFRLKAGSPALSLGFVPVDFSGVGVYGDPAWIAEAKVDENLAPFPVAILPEARPGRTPAPGRAAGARVDALGRRSDLTHPGGRPGARPGRRSPLFRIMGR